MPASVRQIGSFDLTLELYTEGLTFQPSPQGSRQPNLKKSAVGRYCRQPTNVPFPASRPYLTISGYFW
jgi:hypothetical protein